MILPGYIAFHLKTCPETTLNEGACEIPPPAYKRISTYLLFHDAREMRRHLELKQHKRPSKQQVRRSERLFEVLEQVDIGICVLLKVICVADLLISYK